MLMLVNGFSKSSVHRRTDVSSFIILDDAIDNILTDCVKETYVREKSGGPVSQVKGRGRGESASSSVTDDRPSEETNLLLTAARDDDCLIPVSSFPRDILKPVETLGEGIFGEVTMIFRIVFGLLIDVANLS